MSPEPRSVSEVRPKESLGSLSRCLVDGDAEQRTRARRALTISIFLQSAVLAALILVPLFGKAERITYTIITPVPPYSRYHSAAQNQGAQRPHPRGPQPVCRFCQPPRIPPNIVMRDHTATETLTEEPPIDGALNIPGAPNGFIPLSDSRQRGPAQENIDRRNERPRIVHYTRLDPAMLIHRVEPVYTPLAKQIHKEGRVELRAIIGTDGTIQSLQVMSGDALFLLSAQEAVQQWRYRPTVLNGQPVEIDTYITVIYIMQH
jgi:protein TonB